VVGVVLLVQLTSPLFEDVSKQKRSKTGETKFTSLMIHSFSE
jgi:hypothetical protein